MDKEKISVAVQNIVNKEGYRPVSKSGLASIVDLPSEIWPQFFELLQEMECGGKLIISKSGKVLCIRNSGLHVAVMQNITKTGGFASLGKDSDDIFIRKEKLSGAMPSDIVVIRIIRGTRRSAEGEVVKISKRNFVEFTAVYHKIGKLGFVTADSGIRDRIPVSDKTSDAKNNDKVLARYNNGKAEIITAFGPSTSAKVCSRAVLSRYHVRLDFPAPVMDEAKLALDKSVNPEGRLDLRKKIIFTIDSESSKDLDDAVSVERLENGYRLGVHIADVSNYVTPGSQLDHEAFIRGTSIYYADNVIPMLPKELSNGICSLNPNEDRLAFSALIDLDGNGNVTGAVFKKSIIRSRVKGVYEEINKIFSGDADDGITEKYSQVMPTLMLMRELSDKLSNVKNARGALDLESPDSEIETDSEGRAVSVSLRVQGISEIIIENFMLCANEAVAAYVKGLQMPLVYRVHDEPEPKKLEELAQVLKALGIDARAIHPGIRTRDIAAVIQKLNATGKGAILSSLVLRAMAKARYSPDCTGHFGLALENYCHFTSPIRRYPDLCVHRILSDIIKYGPSDSIVSKYRDFAAESSLASSDNEIRAMQVERECESIYKAEYMACHIGKRFEGAISSVKSFGFYVALPDSVEGLCRVEDIKDGYYVLDEKNMQLVCERNRRKFSLGDSVSIIVARADVSSGQIDFQLV